MNNYNKLWSNFYYGNRVVDLLNKGVFDKYLKDVSSMAYVNLAIKYPNRFRVVILDSLFDKDSRYIGELLPSYLIEQIKEEPMVAISEEFIVNNQPYNFRLKFRSLSNKRFLTVGTTPVPIGFSDFLPTFTYNTPIILVEGEKDMQALKEVYPYTLAMATNNVSQKTFELLRSLTSNLIVGFDNDPPGNNGYNSLIKKNRYTKSNLSIKRLLPLNHDFGEYFECQDSFFKQQLLEYFNTQLRILGLNL